MMSCVPDYKRKRRLPYKGIGMPVHPPVFPSKQPDPQLCPCGRILSPWDKICLCGRIPPGTIIC